jgi:hypothetical protein
MTTEIPTSFKFQHILAHTFPGFFSAVTLFMAIDILSPMNLTSTFLLSKGIDGLLAFSGFVLLIGSILGIIIDGIQHCITTKIFEKKDDEIKKLLCERKYIIIKYLFHIKTKQKLDDVLNIKGRCHHHCSELKCPYNITCEFEWKKIASTDKIMGDEDKKLKEFLSKTYDLDWVSTTENFQEIDDNSIMISKDGKKLTLKFNEKISKVTLDVDGLELDGFKAEKKNNKWTISSNECPINKYNLNRFYLFMALGDKFVPLHDLMTDLFYSYSEFYLNAFISLMPFSIIAPIYLFKVFQISGSIYHGVPVLAILASILISIIAMVCYNCSYNVYQNYLIAQNSALSGFVDSITRDVTSIKDKNETKEYLIKGTVGLEIKK